MLNIINFEPTNLKEREAIELLNDLFETAVATKVSDVAFEIRVDEGVRVRFKRDGEYENYTVPGLTNPATGLFDWYIASVFKEQLFSKAMIDRMSRSCQDGRMRLFYNDRPINFRVAVAPTTIHGSFYIVCRILDSNNASLQIDSLDMMPMAKEVIKRILLNPEGALVICGPTGSGKTTTLYSGLGFLNKDSRSIITIENPSEYQVDGYCQIDVNGYDITWESALSTVVRLSPHIVMVGEIRDKDSAMAALRCGQTGHSLLTTIHAPSAGLVPIRMLGLGVPSYMIATVLTGIVSQRLLKRIPDDTDFEWRSPTETENIWLKKNGVWHEGMLVPKLAREKLAGRIPILEIIEIDAEIRDLLFNEASEEAIVEAAAKQPQYETLAEAGVRLVLAGKTILEEVMHKTKDGIIVPTKKRFEQTMLESGLIKMEDLVRAQELVIEASRNGFVVSLEGALESIGIGADIIQCAFANTFQGEHVDAD